MKYTLVKPDGSIDQSHEFDQAPTLAPNKGRWLPDAVPEFNPATHVLNKVTPVAPDATQIAYQIIPRPLPEVRAEKLAELERAYDAAVQQPIDYMGTTFQADYGSQEILTKTLTSLNPLGSVPQGFAWWDANNVPVPMTLAELNGLATAMLMRGWAAFQHKQAKKQAVRDAQTVEEVNSITW